MSSKKFEVGDRVYYRAVVNNPGHYKPDELVPGEIIHRFMNGGEYTYRIRLDLKWTDRVAACGQPIVVGNVSAGRIIPIAAP